MKLPNFSNALPRTFIIVLFALLFVSILLDIAQSAATRPSGQQSLARVTPTGGQELTFLKQLIGNIGRFNTPDKGPTGGGPVTTPGR